MLAELEQELINVIKASPVAQKVREIDSMPQTNANALVKQLMSQAPAIYITLRPIKLDGAKAQIAFDVILLARNARGHKAAVQGDGQTIGLYQLIEHVADAIWKTPGWDVTDINRPRDEVFFAAGLQVASLIVKTNKFTMPFDIAPESLNDFATVHIDHTLATNAPVAQDIVNLET